MKDKSHRRYHLINYLMSTNKFKFIFLLSLCIAAYGGYFLTQSTQDLFLSMITSLQFGAFLICFFTLFFLNTIYACSEFHKLEFYMIRFHSKKNYFYDLLKTVFLLNSLLLLIFFLLYFGFLIFSKISFVSIDPYLDYSISNLAYSIFSIIKLCFFLFLTTWILTIFYHKNKISWVYLFGGVFLIGFLFTNTFLGIENDFQFAPWNYLKFIQYSSFQVEALHTLVYFSILSIIPIVLTLYSNRKSTPSGHYLFLHDLSYLYRRRGKVLLIFFGFIAIITWINSNPNLKNIDMFHSSLGTNIDLGNLQILQFLTYLLHLTLVLFFSTELYLKDLKQNLDSIFLRMEAKEWYLKKLKFISIFLLLFKFIEYLIVSTVFYFKGNPIWNAQVPLLFFSDFLYLLFFQIFFFLLYLLFSMSHKYKLLVAFTMIIFVLVFPKNIWFFHNFLYILMFLILACIWITQWLFRYKNKYILQYVKER